MGIASSFLIGAAGAGSQILDEERKLKAEQRLMDLRSQNALNNWRVQQKELVPFKMDAEKREEESKKRLFDYELTQRDEQAKKKLDREADDFAASMFSETGPYNLPPGYIPTPAQLKAEKQKYMSGYRWDNLKEDQKIYEFKLRPDGSTYKTLRQNVVQQDGAETFGIVENENGERQRVRAFPRTTFNTDQLGNKTIASRTWISASNGQPLPKFRELVNLDNSTLTQAKAQIDKYFDEYEKSDIFRSGNFDFKQMSPQARAMAKSAFERFSMDGDPIQESIEKAIGQALVQTGALPIPTPKPGTGELVPPGTSSRGVTNQQAASASPAGGATPAKNPQEFVAEVRVAYGAKTGKKITLQDMDRLASEGDPDMMEIVRRFDPNNAFGIIKDNMASAAPASPVAPASETAMPNTQGVATEEDVATSNKEAQKAKDMKEFNKQKLEVLSKALEEQYRNKKISQAEYVNELARLRKELNPEEPQESISDKVKRVFSNVETLSPDEAEKRMKERRK